MATTRCEGCGEERDVDGQMYDFGPTSACGQCWLSLLRFIRVGTPPTEKPDYWKRQYAMAVERAVEAEKARDALETELEAYKEALVEREAELQRLRDHHRARLLELEAALEGAVCNRCGSRGTRWTINATGHIVPGTDNALDKADLSERRTTFERLAGIDKERK